MTACPSNTQTEDSTALEPDVDATDEVDGGEVRPVEEVNFTGCVNRAPDGGCDDCKPGECGTGVCHPDLRVCVNCVSDADCPNFCHPSALFCVDCINDGHCPDGFCTDNGQCIDCISDADCGVGVCNVEFGACVGACKNDAACSDGNPCTKDICDDNNECVYAFEPDGATCNDGDDCTSDGFCLEGACLATRTRAQCCEPAPPCGPNGVLVDEDGDTCVDGCMCFDGTKANDAGECETPCGFEGIACPEGAEPQDSDGDGCDDTCACVAADCVKCEDSAACDDGDTCTEDLCVNGVCVALPVPDCGVCTTSCDCLAIGNPDEFAPPCPLDCATCGNWWGCDNGTCKVTCGAQPQGQETCGCEPIACDLSANAVDTDADSCPDACLCADGDAVPPGTPCSGPTVLCTTGCDCAGMPLTQDVICADECAGCKNQWACVGGSCQEVCGLVPPDGDACEGQQLCEATGGDYDPTACGDYACGVPNECLAIIGGCNCGSGMSFDPSDGCVIDDSCGAVPECPPVGCNADLGGVDVDGDGCVDTCICEANGDCGPDALCLRQPGECTGLGTCSALPMNCPPVVPGDPPVCGCDGGEYVSACDALAAGVNIDLLADCGGN